MFKKTYGENVMAEQNHMPPISLVVPFYNEAEANKVAALPVKFDNARVSQTVRIEFMRRRSASRMRIAER